MHFVGFWSREQSRDIHYHHLDKCFHIYLLGCEVSISFQSHSLDECEVTGANKVNLDLSLVSMMGCRLHDKKAPYLKTYTTFQLYELPSIDQEVFLYRNSYFSVPAP